MPPPDTLIGDPLYARLKAHVVDSTGLTYYEDKDADFAPRISRRLASVGIEDCTTYLNILRDPIRGPAELEALIAEITIGETYFFRHREHFNALRDVVLPDLLARNRTTRSLRIWCAGCADGPEVYSVAILLKREIGPQLHGWDVSILGTDINRRCLVRARAGKFHEWALRGVTEDLKRECFAKEGKLWNIAARYKEWVSFQYHNLVEDHFPSLVQNLSAFDLIICRNVMIYFSPELMRRMIRQFHESLVSDGWLLVGPTEPNMTSFTAFRIVNAPGVTLYQKPDTSTPAPAPVEHVFAIEAPPPFEFPSEWLAVPAAAPALERETVEPESTLAEARCYADRGAWENAAQCCVKLLKKDNLQSSVHFYHALIQEQMGKHADAARSLRQAIYLDRQAVLPHYYLGLFLQSRGDVRQAARSFENALELLAARRDTEVLADADGITVAEMKKLANTHLEILRERG